jgi:hypothetical protein
MRVQRARPRVAVPSGAVARVDVHYPLGSGELELMTCKEMSRGR